MGNALRHVRGESQKNIVRFIEGLSGKYSRWDIWQDFIIMSAIAIANTMGGPQVKAREGIYRSRAEKYSTCQRVPETAHQLSDFGVVRGTGHRLSCRVYVLHPT